MKKKLLVFGLFLFATFCTATLHAGLVDHGDVTGFPNVNVDAQFVMIAKKYLPEVRQKLPDYSLRKSGETPIDVWKREIRKKAAGLNIPEEKLAAFIRYVADEKYVKNSTIVPAPHPALLEFELYARGYSEYVKRRTRDEMPEPWKKLLALPRKDRLYTTIPALYLSFVRGSDRCDEDNPLPFNKTIERIYEEYCAGCFDSQGCLLTLCTWDTFFFNNKTIDDKIGLLRMRLRGYTVNYVPEKRWRWTNDMNIWVRYYHRGENAYSDQLPDFLWQLCMEKEEILREMAKKDPFARDVIVAFGLTNDTYITKHVRKVAREVAGESEINLPILALRVPYEEAKKLLAGKKEHAALLDLLTIKALEGEKKLAAIDSYIATYPDYTPADMPVTTVALNTHLELNALAGLELVKLGRYEEALKRWLNGSTPEDAGLVAEQILTTDQLLEFCKKYTENIYHEEGFILSRHCVNGEHPFDLRIVEREYIHELVRNILARRLMRENRSAEARQWFTGPVMRKSSEEYFKAEEALKNAKNDNERLDACLRMAALMRFEGDRICGTYLEPDNLICLGHYPCVWGTNMKGLKLNKVELPRYSYRYKAAELYRKAATLTKDTSIQAACYWSAGTLLKNIAPKIADADFKKLAVIAPELTEKNWFKPLKKVDPELQGFYNRSHFCYGIGGVRNLQMPMPVIPEVKLPVNESNANTLCQLAREQYEKYRLGEGATWDLPQIQYALYLAGKKGVAEGYFWCGVIELYMKKNEPGALALYRAALAVDPKCEKAIADLGTIYFYLGYYKEGFEQFRLVADDPESKDEDARGMACFTLAYAHLMKQPGIKHDTQTGLDYLKKAIEVGNPEAIQFQQMLNERIKNPTED